jgi:hypothetical protein
VHVTGRLEVCDSPLTLADLADALPNKVMAREYQLGLPAVKKLEAELAATRKRLERAGKW